MTDAHKFKQFLLNKYPDLRCNFDINDDGKRHILAFKSSKELLSYWFNKSTIRDTYLYSTIDCFDPENYNPCSGGGY